MKELELKELELKLKLNNSQTNNDDKTIKSNKINININNTSNTNDKLDTKQTTIIIGKLRYKECQDCSKYISVANTRCQKCFAKHKFFTSEKPSYDQLKQDLKTLGSVLKVAKKYNKSDKTIKKYLDTYEKYEQSISSNNNH
jgi:hypothetical protein